MIHSESKLNYFLGLKDDATLFTQIKLTYIGLQEKATPSVGIVPEGTILDLNMFRKFRQPGLNYGNDDVVKSESCVLSTADYKKVYLTTARSFRSTMNTLASVSQRHGR